MTDIIYSSPFVPPELIAALGLEARRIATPARPGQGPVDVTAGACPFMRGFVSGACSDPEAGAIVFASTCDQMRRAYDIASGTSGIPMFLLNVPATWQSGSARELYHSELLRLADFLQSLCDETLSDSRLAEVMIEYEQRRDAPVPEGDGVALALVGGPLSDGDAGLVELIERFGGRVALDGTEYGERTRPARFDPLLVRADPVRALACAYFSIPDAFRRPDTILHDWLARMTAERGIRGVILEHCLWCDLWRAQAARIRQDLDIPVLAVDLDGQGAAPRNSTRIQAFIEGLT